jgi:antitoxin HicB
LLSRKNRTAGRRRFFDQFVDLEDTFTEGETLEEARFNAVEALSEMLDFHLEAGHDFPILSLFVPGAYCIAPGEGLYTMNNALPPRFKATIWRCVKCAVFDAREIHAGAHFPFLSLRKLLYLGESDPDLLVLATERPERVAVRDGDREAGEEGRPFKASSSIA